MQEVEITLSMIDKARLKAKELGKLNNSILKEEVTLPVLLESRLFYTLKVAHGKIRMITI